MLAAASWHFDPAHLASNLLSWDDPRDPEAGSAFSLGRRTGATCRGRRRRRRCDGPGRTALSAVFADLRTLCNLWLVSLHAEQTRP